MKKLFKFKVVAILFMSLLLPFNELNAQAVKHAEIVNADDAISYVRELHFDRDFNLGKIEGERLSKKYPNSVKLKAWYLTNMARNDMAEKAVQLAEELVSEYPENPWSYFALARALNSYDKREKEAVDVSDKALSMKPNHPDFLWMRAVVLSTQVGDEEEIAFVDSVLNVVDSTAPLLITKGSTFLSKSGDTTGTKSDEFFSYALELFEKARNINPEYLDAWYLPAFYLNRRGKNQESYQLYKKSVRLSTALRVHSEYWRLVTSMDNMGSSEKQSEITADIDWLMENRIETAEMLQSIARQYGQLGLNKEQKGVENKLLKKYPQSLAVEWVLVGRYRQYEEDHSEQIIKEKSPEKEKYQRMLWDFINRPQHQRKTLLGDAYRNLFYLYREDSTISTDSLLMVVEGMVEYEGINPHITHAGGAIALAERGVYFDRAKTIAKEGVDAARENINEDKDWAFETEDEYEQAMDQYTAIMYDALGWVFFQEGKLDSAQKYLAHSYSLNSENDDNLYHLGKLEEEKQNLDKAEDYYIKGMAEEGEDNRKNKTAIKNLYINQNGSIEGFESYIAGIKNKEAGNRKNEILNGRLKAPEPLTSFEMKNLKGELISSNFLKGKITVINMWGKWCGPCVKEMPDIQKLHEKYQASSEVFVLTINNDPDINAVKDWMKEKELNFPVLRDNGYLNEIGMHLFPTTWFVNKKGEIAFIQEGYTEDLVQEFSWRVEALKE